MQIQHLTLSGTPFDIGYQHGLLLKEKIHENIHNHLKELSPEAKAKLEAFSPHIPELVANTPSEYLEEMQGIAKGCMAPFSDILLLNLFPEMFHCCGITATGSASKNGTLYHARVLDYSAGKDLHSSAVIFLVKPQNRFSFMNITYAGFIGSITGMNEKKISLGEIGGLGYGNWKGCPMPLLLRSILERASCLKDVKKILESFSRTCEYYYVFGDGNTQDSFGCYATPGQIQYIEPGKDYSLCQYHPDKDLAIEKGLSQKEALHCPQPKDTLLLTGLAALERYPILHQRILTHYGSIDELSLMQIIKQPVARTHNLHNAIFHPSSLEVWISHAGPSGAEKSPACNEPYSRFSMNLHPEPTIRQSY
jgi:hypothetical protein